MPPFWKAVITLGCILAAVGMYLYQSREGLETNGWIAVGLAAFMIVAVWLFPEAKGGKQDKT
ncbi:MAG: hypothetical protein Kilf2KO_26850 [Rhodospirillales bacterium]